MRVHVALGVGLSGPLPPGPPRLLPAKDLVYLTGTLQLIFLVWGSILVDHVLTHGIPIRIVADGRPPPRP